MRITHSSRCLIPIVTSPASRRSPLLPSLRLLLPLRAAAKLPLATSCISMADAENLSTVAADDAKYGFTRDEMYSASLAGTVDAYDRHMFLCHKSPADWASRVEEDLLPKLLSSALKSRKNVIPVKTRLTICEGGASDGDVMIFPEMIKYKGLTESNLDGFVDDVLVNGKPWASSVQEALTGAYVFVCAHGSRDKRCGVCGPPLIEKLKEEAALRGLQDQLFVSACSHVGGHKYAGNLIIYSPDSEGKIMGHWYGYVTPNDVPDLLDQHIAKGQIIERLWRGQMGASVEADEKAEQNIANGKDAKKGKKKREEISTENTKENVAGCCQGANGFTCCRDTGSEATEGKKVPSKLTSWVGSFEQRDVLVSAAVVGAVATVAIAYSFYRRSG